MTLYMLYGLRELGLSAATLGLIIGVGGVGAFVGAFAGRRAERVLRLGPAMLLTLGLGQLMAICIPLAADTESGRIPLLILHQLLGDGLLIAYYVQMITMRQLVVPEHVLARANATFTLTRGLLQPLGALAAGALASATDVRTAIWAMVVVGLFAPVAFPWSPVMRVQSWAELRGERTTQRAPLG